MNNKVRAITIAFGIIGLSSCIIDDGTGRNLYYPSPVVYNDDNIYAGHSYQLPGDNYKYNSVSTNESVVVPESYHVGESKRPVSFQDRDSAWINKQSSHAYTIELAQGDRPAQVAQALFKAPKNNRMAQVKYQRWGKTYYRAVYGTFDNAEEAQKTLDSLPAELKQNAAVKNWSSIKSS